MAGFFGFFDYTKPGPGVPKDAPPKPRIVVFFEILGRKFWNLVKINIMFNIFNLPATAAAVLIVTQFFFQGNIIPGDVNDPDRLTSELITRFMLAAVVLCIPVITVGPAQAGFTYILRNYSREEHAFIWWDFKDNAIKNLKESLAICVIDFIAMLLMGIAINFYLSYRGAGILASFATGLLIMAFVIFLMMHLYIYPMLVTFKLSVKQVYKNSLIFAIVKFFPNLGILLLCSLIIFASLYYTIIGIILYMLITVSFIGLLTNYYVYPKLKKYIIEKLEEENEEYDDDGYEEDGFEEDENGEGGECGDDGGMEEKGNGNEGVI